MMACVATAEPEISAGRTLIELRPGPDFNTVAYAYCRWKKDGLFEQVFADAPDMRLVDLLDWTYQPTVEAVAAYADGQLIGFGWICQAYKVEGRLIGEIGVAFFRGVPLPQWGEALRMLVEHAFERGLEEIYGVSRISNRAAHILARRCRMRQVDRLPWEAGPRAESIIYMLERN